MNSQRATYPCSAAVKPLWGVGFNQRHECPCLPPAVGCLSRLSPVHRHHAGAAQADVVLQGRARALDLAQAGLAAQLPGKAAIANARLAYADYKAVFGSQRFQALRAQGARVQRPLWASTSTKNPHYPDLMYVDTLVGPDTVNTVPPQTLHALLDHGVIRPNTVEEDLAGAGQTLHELEQLGIAMRVVTQELEDEGVASFSQAFAEVVEKMEERRQAVVQAA